MLKTCVPEREMDVVTTLRGPRCRLAFPEHDAPWTAVWDHQEGRPESISLVWLHFWQGPTSVGGLAEAHESVVVRVQAGEIPAQGQAQREEAEPDEQLAHTAI